MTAVASTVAQGTVDRLVAWLERGVVDGLFAPDVFADLTFPHWRIQVRGAEAVNELKAEMHPPAGTTRIERIHPTERGLAAQVEERWESGGEQWYCREIFVCDLDERGRIAELNYYCTGDWDEARVAEHAREVTLLRR